MNGIKWYNEVCQFLSKNECFLIISDNDKNRKVLSEIIKSNISCGILVKAEFKRYGLYVSRGKNAAIATKVIVNEFCCKLKTDYYELLSKKIIYPYTVEQFKESHQLKNIYVHRGQKVPKALSYKKQLETPSWNKFRKMVFAKKGAICEICGASKNLQVHHPKYKSGHKAWEYTLDEVMVVCCNCHKKIHGIK
jgi:hypothetical protein